MVGVFESEKLFSERTTFWIWDSEDDRMVDLLDLSMLQKIEHTYERSLCFRYYERSTRITVDTMHE